MAKLPTPAWNPAEDKQPEEVGQSKGKPVEDEEQWFPHQPGAKDITFPGLQGVPKWMLSVLTGVHVNLGHPGTEALVRHLAQAGASGQALLAAKHLKCQVCNRTKPPTAARPAKIFQAKRFNDRLMLDLIFVRDVSSQLYCFLSQVDDGTTYHVVDLLVTRSSEDVARVLANGWFKYFSFPDEMLLDAEGAMRGWDFEVLAAQAGIRVRFVPPDAHFQIGRAERHGQAVKHIMRRLINQYAATTAAEMQEIANLACFAKNSLARRSGASPCQWVYGRNPKIPNSILSEPDAIEAKQVIQDSERLRRIEEMRHSAMQEFLQFEHSEALRKAILRKSRPWRGPVEVGTRIAYFRQKSQLDGEGTAEGYRQGIVIGVDPTPTGSVWVRNNRGRVVQVAREQLRGVEGEELWTPSLDDLKMLRSAEEDLATKHAVGFDHRGPAPQQQEDRLILDAAGEPQQPGAELQAPPLAIMLMPVQPAATSAPSTPVPGTPRTRKQKQLADMPSSSPQPAKQLKQAEPEQQAAVRFEEPADVTAGWFLDPEGRPTLVTDNATNIPVPGPQYDAAQYPFRTTWSFHEGSWKKLEDRVPWAKAASRDISEKGKPLERLVTTFSPNQEAGRRPSIQSTAETQRGVKRNAAESELPPRDLEQPTMSDAGQQLLPGQDAPSGQAQQQEGAEAMATFCRECGCPDQHQDLQFFQCVRCSSHSFVEDPREVRSWFDEVEERQALQQLQDEFTFDVRAKQWSPTPRAELQDVSLPDRDELDEAYDKEAEIMHVGQCFQQLPEDAGQEPLAVWSVATKAGDNEWQWQEIFSDINVAMDTLDAWTQELEDLAVSSARTLLIKHKKKNDQTSRKPQKQKDKTWRAKLLKAMPRRERHWLRRHGRHCVYVCGWDGGEPELQPIFQYDNFAKLYFNYVNDVAKKRTATIDPEVNKDAEQYMLESSLAGNRLPGNQHVPRTSTTSSRRLRLLQDLNPVMMGPMTTTRQVLDGQQNKLSRKRHPGELSALRIGRSSSRRTKKNGKNGSNGQAVSRCTSSLAPSTRS